MSEIRKKLNLKKQELIILNLPSELDAAFAQVENWKKYDQMPEGTHEAVLAFAKDQVELNTAILDVMDKIDENTILWFAYPKKASKRYKSDVTRDRGWEALYPYQYEPVRQISFGEDWSALRFRLLEQIPTRQERMIKEKKDAE